MLKQNFFQQPILFQIAEYQSPITEGNNDEKTLAFIKCGILINDLIEKPL